MDVPFCPFTLQVLTNEGMLLNLSDVPAAVAGGGLRPEGLLIKANEIYSSATGIEVLL